MLSLFGFITLLLGVGFLGGRITQASLTGWYNLLRKPFGNPPSWVFAPVWILLYLMLAVSVWRIWKIRAEKDVHLALILFFLQLLLNALWTPAFFGLRNPLLGLCVITLLWIFIGLTILEFLKIEKTSAALLLPYWGWVTFAAWLNAGIWRLNR